MRITIKTGNAAFRESYDAAAETGRILRDLAERVQTDGMPEPGDPIILYDINGNRVGEAVGQ